MSDPIEDQLIHIQERCRLSWSENEIIALIEAVILQRRQELKERVTLPVFDPDRLVVGKRERWS